MIPENLLTKKRIAEVIGVHEQTIMRMVREKRFPPPLRIGAVGSAVRWRAKDIEDWIDARIEQGAA